MARCKQRRRRWQIGVGCLVVAGLCALPLVLSVQAMAQPNPCTLALLQGGYIWQDFGFGVQDDLVFPVATAGRVQVDATGNFTGVTANSDVNEIQTNVTMTGTVTVDPDCTGTITGTDSDGDSFNIVIFVDPLSGNFTMLRTNAGVVISTFVRKDGT